MDFTGAQATQEVPRVSIVVPIYQGSSFMAELVHECEGLRLIHQSLCYQLILVCDDPRDNSTIIAQTVSQGKAWIKVINLAFNSGQHLATAAGIVAADGQWIATLDEDLQFRPKEIPHMLLRGLEQSYDIIYARPNNNRGNRHSAKRNIASDASKLIVSILTRQDYSIISSFRLIRSEIANSIAFTIDKHSFLDASLFTVTSPRRRGIYMTRLIDKREKFSGYKVQSLVSHFSRLLMSASLSGSSLLQVFALVFGLLIVTTIGLSGITGLVRGAQIVAPGWTSLLATMTILSSTIIIILIGLLKFLSVLVQRSTGAPSYITVDRSKDQCHCSSIQCLLRFEESEKE